MINSININGWTEKSKELKEKICKHGNPDVICISETHLSENEEINIEGYRFYGHHRVARHQRRSGGVAIMIKNQVFLEFSVRPVPPTYDGILAVSLKQNKTDYEMLVIVNYLPPCNSEYGRDPEEFFGKLLLINYMSNTIDAIFMCGDFNSRIGTIQDVNDDSLNIPTRTSVDNTVNSHGRCLLDFLNDSMCCVLNGRLCEASFTCHTASGSSTVDYMIVPYDVLDQIESTSVINVENLIHENNYSQLLGEGSSQPDHELLQTTFNITRHIESVKQPGENIAQKRVPRKFHKEFMNNARIRSLLVEKIDEMLQEERLRENMSTMYEELSELIRAEMECFKKCKKRKATHYKPYWTPALTEYWKAMKRAYSDAKKFLNSRDKRRHKLKISTIPEIQKYKKVRDEFDRELRTAKREFNVDKIADIDELANGDPKRFWDEVNKLGPSRKRKVTCEALDSNGEITRNPDLVEKLWYKEYSDLYGKYLEGNFDEQHRRDVLGDFCVENGNNETLSLPISVMEVERAVKAAKDKKACGLDKIPNEALRSPLCVQILSKLFNLCYDNGLHPETWSKCIILPIGKGKVSISTQPLTHRGLALQSCIYKLYSLVLNKRLSCYFEENSLLHETQNGFRPGRSCVDHIFTLTETVRMNLPNASSKVYACFVDLRRAFPSVDRSLLLWKLSQLGVKGKMLKALQAVYRSPSYCVKLNEGLTPMFESVLGLPEGDPNSPLCFAAFVNDFLVEMENSGLGIYYGSAWNEKFGALAFADDIVLVNSTESGLQEQMNLLHRYCRKWRLTVNVDKTKAMVFRKNSQCKPGAAKIYYDGKEVEQVASYKYLGVELDDVLSFKQHFVRVASSGSRALGSVMCKVRELRDLGFKCYDKLVKSCVFPVLDYGAEVFGLAKSKLIEDVQYRAARFYLGLNRSTPLTCLNLEMGWYSANDRRKSAVMRYYARLLKMDDTRLPKRVFLSSRNNPNGWCGGVKELLKELKLEQYWEIRSDVPREIFDFALREDIKERVRSEIDNMPKLRTYKTLRVGLEMGPQVKCLTGRWGRSLMTQLRCGVLPLRIEVGRFNREPLKERICGYCKENEVESEMHFVLTCPLYETERRCFLVELGKPQMVLTLSALMSHPFAFSKYIQKIWHKRSMTEPFTF